MLRAGMMREMGWQVDEEMNRDKTVEADRWRNEAGSWFQRLGGAYAYERSVIFKEMVGGR